MLFVSVLVYKSPVYEKKAFDLICERLASIGYPQVIWIKWWINIFLLYLWRDHMVKYFIIIFFF